MFWWNLLLTIIIIILTNNSTIQWEKDFPRPWTERLSFVAFLVILSARLGSFGSFPKFLCHWESRVDRWILSIWTKIFELLVVTEEDYSFTFVPNFWRRKWANWRIPQCVKIGWQDILHDNHTMLNERIKNMHMVQNIGPEMRCTYSDTHRGELK